MSRLKDGINDLFIFDEKKRNSKSLSVFIYIFLIILSIVLIFYGSMSIKIIDKDNPITFGSDVIRNQYVSLTVKKVYSPCGYTASWLKITGYYCITETTDGKYCVVYVDSDNWNNGELGAYFTDDSKIGHSIDVQNSNYNGTTAAMDPSYGSRAMEYYKLYIDKTCNIDNSDYADVFTDYYVYPGDSSYLFIAWSVVILGITLLASSLFVGFMNIRKRKEIKN